MPTIRISPSVRKSSIREIIDTFQKDKLGLVAMQMKKGDGYYRLTYREVQSAVRNVGNALLKMGVKKGDRIGVISENRVEWALTYLTVASIGAVIVPFDILLQTEELLHVMKASEAKIVFTSESYLEKVQTIREHVPQIKKTVLFDPNQDKYNQVNGIRPGEAHRTDIKGFIKSLVSKVLKKDEPFSDESLVFWDALTSLGALLDERGEGGYDLATVDPKDLAALIFTSGTTGLPKGVMLSHWNLASNADSVQMGTKLGPGDNWIIVLPYHHTYPTILGVLLPIVTYGTITTVPTLRPNILIETMKETGATCIPAVPMLIEKIYKNIFVNVKEKGPVVAALFYLLYFISKFFYKVLNVRIGKYLLGSVRRQLGVTRLKFFISGAGPIPKEIIDGMEVLGLTVMQGYGLTETSPVVSATMPENNKPGTVGCPIANVEVKIIHPDAEGHGELLVRGPNIMMGYYNMPGKTAEIIDDEGWLHTGDIAMIDRDGFITISGREKNIIVTRGGKNIYPEEIENKLLESPYIAEVVVLPKAESLSEAGEVPYAIIYPNFEAITALENEHKKTLGEEGIKELIGKEIKDLTSGMANYKLLRGFEITNEELPKTSSKKVKRFMFNKK